MVAGNGGIKPEGECVKWTDAPLAFLPNESYIAACDMDGVTKLNSTGIQDILVPGKKVQW